MGAARSSLAARIAIKVPLLRKLSEEQAWAIASQTIFCHSDSERSEARDGRGGAEDAPFVIPRKDVKCLLGSRALVLFGDLAATVGAAKKTAPPQARSASAKQEMAHHIDAKVGAMIGRDGLRCVRQLGRGCYGEVVVVEDGASGSRYALKRVRPIDSKEKKQLDGEIAVLAGNDHPLLMRLVATFETARSVNIVTEYMSGGDLLVALQQLGRRLSRAEAQFYAGSMVLMLQALSERNIVHRDIKPENVMLDTQGYPKLADFGSAKRLDERGGRTFSFVGSPLYMAPEVITGSGHGLEADAWSVGVMLFQMVCHRHPFGADCADDRGLEGQLWSALRSRLEFPRDYRDGPGRSLIGGLLSRRKDRRPGSGPGGWQEVRLHPFFRAGPERSESSGAALFDGIVGRELPAPYSSGVVVT